MTRAKEGGILKMVKFVLGILRVIIHIDAHY